MSLPKIYAGKRRQLLWLLVANGIAQAVCGVGLAMLLRETLSAGRAQTIPWLAASEMAALGVLTLLLRIRQASDAERLGQSYVTRVRLRLFDRLAARPSRGAHSGERWGVTMTRMISDLNSLRNWVSTGIARAIVAGITATGLLAGLAFISPWPAASIAAMVAICLLAASLLTPRLRGLIRESRRRRGRLANNLGEKILALSTVSQLGRARQERAKVRSHSVRLTNVLVRRVSMAAALHSLPNLMLPLAVAGIAIAASMNPERASDSVVAVLLLGMIASSLRDLARAWNHRLAFEEGRRRIDTILAGTRIKQARDAGDLPGDGPVSLEYVGVEVEGLFQKLDQQIKRGEHILLVGASGSGKSTLLSLAARMFDPASGDIRLDGLPLSQLRFESLRSSVQRVSADMPLLRGTVGENISYGLVDTDPEWVEIVIEVCGLDEQTPLLPEGLATRVEERGRNLPEGLRSRIALARAMMPAPRLLLVDDLTFSTDPLAARALTKLRRSMRLTTIVVGTESDDASEYDWVWNLDHRESAGIEEGVGAAEVASAEKTEGHVLSEDQAGNPDLTHTKAPPDTGISYETRE